jgi:hypothetical protein
MRMVTSTTSWTKRCCCCCWKNVWLFRHSTRRPLQSKRMTFCCCCCQCCCCQCCCRYQCGGLIIAILFLENQNGSRFTPRWTLAFFVVPFSSFFPQTIHYNHTRWTRKEIALIQEIEKARKRERERERERENERDRKGYTSFRMMGGCPLVIISWWWSLSHECHPTGTCVYVYIAAPYA